MAAALFASCQKDTVTLQARMGQFQSDSKVYMDDHTPCWYGGEDVVINDNVYGINVSGGNASFNVLSAAVYKAVFPADYVVEGTTEQLLLPRIQYCQYEGSGQRVMAPMGAYSQDGTTLQFNPLGALLAITITNSTERGSLVLDKVSVRSSSAALWGHAEVVGLETDTPRYVITDPYQQGVNDSVVLALDDEEASIGATISRNGSRVVYVFIPGFTMETSNQFTIRVFAHSFSTDRQYCYVLSQANAYGGNIPLAMMASVPFAMSSDNEHIPHQHPQGSIDGLFTVGVSSDRQYVKVYFSQGNLQWNGSQASSFSSGQEELGIWRFAEHQYDIIGSPSSYTDGTATTLPYCTYPGNVSGSDNALIVSEEYDGWVDLFGWGTSGYNNKYPNLVTLTNSDYGNGNNNIAGTQYDWGVRNNIDNGGQGWRTLSQYEWNYLLNERSGGNAPDINGTVDARYALIRLSIGGGYISGMLIFPDEFAWPTEAGAAPNRINVSHATNDMDWLGASTYTYNQFNALQNAGCVFLPASGWRNGSSNVRYVGEHGYYWSSSYSDESNAYRLYFNPSMVATNSGSNRYTGFSVRLVKNKAASSK